MHQDRALQLGVVCGDGRVEGALGLGRVASHGCVVLVRQRFGFGCLVLGFVDFRNIQIEPCEPSNR